MKDETFGIKAIQFYSSLGLKLPGRLNINVLNPYNETEVMACVTSFFSKYFSDKRERFFLVGINPGRFGGGITGISFTDPVALRIYCDIDNSLGAKRELSSEFIYKVIEAYGGAAKFYHDFFITAICPLGFMKGNVNYNYYDDPKLQQAVFPFIKNTWQQQIEIGARKDVLIVFGSGKNKRFIETLNTEIGSFKKIISLDHPRFIMQYRRRRLNEYVDQYLATLNALL